MKLTVCISGQEVTEISPLLNSLYKKREIIFFDETVTGYIIVGDSSEKSPRDYQVYLEIGIVPKELIDDDLSYSIKSFVVLETEITDLAFEETVDAVCYKVYKFTVPISYPKRKLVDPQVIFNAYIQNNVVREGNQLEAVMKDYQPFNERNLLQELNISNEQFHLSTKVTERAETSENDNQKDLNGTHSVMVAISSNLVLPIYSALVIKLKSTKPAGKNNELLTCFSIEASEQLAKLSLSTTPISIKIVDFDIEFNGKTIDINHGIFESKHIHFQVGESLNLNYKLVNNESDDQLKQVNVNLVLEVLKVGEKFQSNKINTTWSPFIDFNLIAPPINNSLKSTSANNPSQSMTSLKKRTGPNFASTSNFKKYGSTTSIPSKRLASTSTMMVNLNGNSNNTTNFYGLKLTFNGKLNIKMGEVSNWKLQAINESSNPLNLSVMVQNHNQQRSSHTSRQHQQISPGPTNQLNGSQPQIQTSTNAKPGLSLENKYHLYNLYKNMKLPNQGVIILNNDLRLGPLGPNCVFETEIKLLGISKGVFNLEGMNIYDLDTGDGLDFGKLVEVFVT